jgi:hypothetical protein
MADVNEETKDVETEPAAVEEATVEPAESAPAADAKPEGGKKKKDKAGKTAPVPKVDLDDEEPAPETEVKREPPLVTAEPARARTATMVAEERPTNAPPAMPTASAPVDLSMGGVEDPTAMPGPRGIPDGHPGDPAAAPGRVPPGDSRSLRHGKEFALVYRRETFVITRAGTVGTRGVWRVVEYPTSASASHSYAKECSRFVSEGYSDYRD